MTSQNIGLSNHLPVFFVRKYARDNVKCSTGKKESRITYRDMKCLDDKKFLETLEQAPWDTAFVNEDIDDVVHAWEQTLNDALDSHCPWHEKHVKQINQAPWMSKAVIKHLHIRDHLLKVARRKDNLDDWANYHAARNKSVSVIRSAKSDFYTNSFEDNKNNPRTIWKSIKTLTGFKKNTIQINKLKVKGSDIDDKTEMAEHFNSYFYTIAEKIRSQIPNISFDLSNLENFVKSQKNHNVEFSIPVITSMQVIKIIMKISLYKACGIIKIGGRVLRIAAPAVASSITRIINMSFSTGKFPTRWKTSVVTPLFKSGTECDPCNYRPISVLPMLSKIIERHVHDSLYLFLNENKLIYTRQSGFRRCHSTETALIKIIDELLFNLDNNVSGMVLIDYRKAFDMVDHDLLITKLKAYGIINQELKWCHSYLSNRKQTVRLGRKMSSEVFMKQGVPQGSILGPLFFIIFINDLPIHVTSQLDLYADDTIITDSADFRNLSDLERSLNNSVSEIQCWADTNKLPLNESKTKVLMITGKRLASRIHDELTVTVGSNKILDNVDNTTLLGLEIDSSLSFDGHVEKVCKKLASCIAILRKIQAFLPLDKRLQYYNAIILPVMSYVSVIWSSCDQGLLNRVLKLQKRAARTILFANRQAPSVALFNKLSWITFYEQCKIDKCSILYKRIHNNLPSYLGDYIIMNYIIM